MKKVSDDIYVGKNILGEIKKYIKDFDKILILSNETVAELYLEEIKKILEEEKKIFYFVIKDGEKYKNIDSIMSIYDFMIKNNFSRKSLLISLGGGVVCDMGGYIAATYMRGIEFIQIPTSLLAQVDASVGGKVAINHLQCKNMIGAFKQPCKVVVDVNFLKTLSKKEFKTGIGEILKYCFLTKNGVFLDNILKLSEIYTKENIVELIEKDNFIEKVVVEAIKIKKYYVDIDPFEKKERMFLNFGHTYAHALENFFNYEGISHGEAVSRGIIFDLELALLRGNIDKKMLDDTKKLFKKFKIDTDLIYMSKEKIFCLMKKDKKNSFENIVTIAIDKDKNLSKTIVSLDEVGKILDKYKNNFLRASIDIGTNSCRLLIAEVSKEKENLILKRIFKKEINIVKLGEEVNKNGFLKEEAIKRTIKILKEYRKIIDNFNINDENIICFATSATRDSSNREYFIKKVKEEANIKIKCISGEQEAFINFMGVASCQKKNGNILVFDIGGGSTEFTLGEINKNNIREIKSLDMGCIRITEKFFLKNRKLNYSEENIKLSEEWIKENLKELEKYKKYNFEIIGVAGTVTTQIAVREKMTEYNSGKVHNSILTLKDLENNLSLYRKRIEKDEIILGLEEKRRDVIIGGTIILKNIMKYFGINKIKISEYDNLVGAILGGISENKK